MVDRVVKKASFRILHAPRDVNEWHVVDASGSIVSKWKTEQEAVDQIYALQKKK